MLGHYPPTQKIGPNSVVASHSLKRRRKRRDAQRRDAQYTSHELARVEGVRVQVEDFIYCLASQAQDSRIYMCVSTVVAAQAPEVCDRGEQES